MLMIAGQFIIPLASDPFGYGWDLFGTTLYLIDIGVVDAKFIWYLSVVAIVTGHIVAVWVGHVTAYTVFRDADIRVPQPIPDACPDDRLHDIEPLDSGAAHRGAEPEVTPTQSHDRMSAFGCKADIDDCTAECPLMTQSGHRVSRPIG